MRLTECGDYFVFDWEYAGLREKEYDLKSLRHQIDSVNAAGGISMTLRGFTAFKKQKRI
jgi:hypothetical protein